MLVFPDCRVAVSAELVGKPVEYHGAVDIAMIAQYLVRYPVV